MCRTDLAGCHGKTGLLRRLARSLSLPADFGQFLQYYYEDADIGDLSGYPLPQLLAGALDHYRFASEPRQRGQARLRCLQQGADAEFAACSTVIEMVADDMPFLIDSTILNINKQDAHLNWIVHPVITARRDEKGDYREVVAFFLRASRNKTLTKQTLAHH